MSKIKNTPEFEAMMREQELAASFDYQEKESLMLDIAAHEAIEKACDEYIEAQKVFIAAQKKFEQALCLYKMHKSEITPNEERLDNAVTQLGNMFKGFNPNDI